MFFMIHKLERGARLGMFKQKHAGVVAFSLRSPETPTLYLQSAL